MDDRISRLAAELVDLRGGKGDVTSQAGRAGESGHGHTAMQRTEPFVLRQKILWDTFGERTARCGHLDCFGVHLDLMLDQG